MPRGSNMKGTARLGFIDTMRGVGALVVLVNHYFAAYGEPPSIPAGIWSGPAGIIQDGQAAVGMFFLFSGFVLARKYVVGGRLSRLSGREWLGFWLARLCRLIVPFAVALWISALLQATVPPAGLTSPAATPWVISYWHARSIGELAEQSLLVRYGYDHLLPQDWTLVLEVYLSLALPLLIVLAAWGTTVLALTVVAAIVVFHIHGALLPFAAGIVVAGLSNRIGVRVAAMRRWQWAALVALGVCVYHCRELLPARVLLKLREGIVWHLSEAGSLLTLLALIGAPRAQEWLARGPLVMLGQVSYSFYLWHFTALQCVTPLVLLALNRLGMVAGTAWWIGLLATAAVNLLVAAVSFQLVERPCIAAARNLNRVFSGGVSRTQAGVVVSAGAPPVIGPQ